MSKQPKCDFCHRFLGKNRIETLDTFPTPMPKLFCSQNCNDNYYSDGYHWKVGENPARRKPTEDAMTVYNCANEKCGKEFEIEEVIVYDSEKSLTPIYCSPECVPKQHAGCFVRSVVKVPKRSSWSKAVQSLTQKQAEEIFEGE